MFLFVFVIALLGKKTWIEFWLGRLTHFFFPPPSIVYQFPYYSTIHNIKQYQKYIQNNINKPTIHQTSYYIISLLHAGHSVQEIATVAAQVEEDKRIRAKHALEAVKMMQQSRTDKFLMTLNPQHFMDLLSGAAEGTQQALLWKPSALLVEASKATGQAVGQLTGKVVTQTGKVVVTTGKVVTQTGKLATDAVVGTSKLGYDVVRETSKKGRNAVVGGVKGTGKVVVETSKLGRDVVVGSVKGTGKVVVGTGKLGLDVVKGTGKVGMDVVKGTGKVGRDVVVGSVIGTSKVVVGTGKVATDVVVGTGKLGYDLVAGTGNAVKSTGKRMSNALLNMSVSNLSSRDLGYGDEDESARSSSLGDYAHPLPLQTNSQGINPYGSNTHGDDDDDDVAPSKGGFFSRRGSGGGSDIQKIPRRGSVTAAVRNLGQRVVGRSRSGGRRASLDNKAGTTSADPTPPKHSVSAQSKLVSMVRGAARSSSSKSAARSSSSSSKGMRRSLSAGKEATRNSLLQETRRASDLEQMQQCLGYGYGDRREDEDESEKDIYDAILDPHKPTLPKRRPSPTGAISNYQDDSSIPGNIVSATASVASTTSSIDDIAEKHHLQDEQNHESISVDSLMYSSREEMGDPQYQDDPPQPPPLSSMLGGQVANSSYSSNDDSFVSALLPPPEQVMGVGDVVDPGLYFT